VDNFCIKENPLAFPLKLAICFNPESNNMPHYCSVSIFRFVVIRWLNHY